MAQDIAQLLTGSNGVKSNISKSLLHKSIVLDNVNLPKRNILYPKHKLNVQSKSFFKKIKLSSKVIIPSSTINTKSDYVSSMLLHNNWLHYVKNCQQQGLKFSHFNRLGALIVLLKSLKLNAIGKICILVNETISQITIYDMDENKHISICKTGLEIGLIIDDNVIALKW